MYYVNNVSGTFTTPVTISPVGQLPAGIQSLEIDDQNRLYTTYQSSQSASGKGFYLLFAENQVFEDTILIADLPPEYVTRNSSQVVTKGNGDIAMFYAEGDVRNDTVICDIFMKRGNIYEIVPVELTSFTASVNKNDVFLSWSTATETNNQGFEIERASLNAQSEIENPQWLKIGYVPGYGTITEKHTYTFVDEILKEGKYHYRLKQIDFDGTSNYSDIVEIEINSPVQFSLEQNYPNPFNPSTKIKFTVPVTLSEVEGSLVTLKVFDVLGNEVATLVNEEKTSGSYEVEYNTVGLSSGVYFYKLQVGNLVETKKMLLLK